MAHPKHDYSSDGIQCSINSSFLLLSGMKRHCYQYVNTKQCLKYLRFGHFRSECKELAACQKCNGCHESRTCIEPSQPPRCINFIRYNDKYGMKTNTHYCVKHELCPSRRLYIAYADSQLVAMVTICYVFSSCQVVIFVSRVAAFYFRLSIVSLMLARSAAKFVFLFLNIFNVNSKNVLTISICKQLICKDDVWRA